jgi:hypothetical protein
MSKDKKDTNISTGEKLETLTSEFEKGIALSKCRKCGCMKGALEEIRDNLAAIKDQDARDLREKVGAWLGKTEESMYT